ncbi:MAG: hypothetical protein WBA23_23085 [Tunicatimonas sp.]|uniref:hypothetical protein n=1 Tax=Tunicatimonas sp. TaxID=1940096 RepID=UPI003C77099C
MKLFVCLSIIILAVFTSCQDTSEEVVTPELMELVNSASVAFAYSGDSLQQFFREPTRAYISGYFYFEDSLAEDIIFGLDIEWLEGTANPIHFAGADWMSLAGLTRNGLLYFPVGSPENREGTPTATEKWEVRNLDVILQPRQWYQMRINADFGAREFVSVRVTGPDIDVTEDISGYPLEYPNYIPVDDPSLTFYTFALRSLEFDPENSGNTHVYFDDIEGGIATENEFQIVFQDGFENQNQIEDIPFVLPVSPLSAIAEDFWYYENEDAKISISSKVSRSGSNSILCNASLAQK